MVLWVSGSSPAVQNLLRTRIDWPITALCHTSPTGEVMLLYPLPISQFSDTKITLAGRCNLTSGIFPVCFALFDHLPVFNLNFSVCHFVVLVFKILAAEPSLFICRNTLIRGASVSSSCVLNAKRGLMLLTVIDCRLLLKLLMLLCLTVFISTSR